MATATMASLNALNTATTAITIDVTKDLDSLSALNTMLSSQEGAIFNIVGELIKYRSAGDAAKAGATAQVSLTGPKTWTIPSNGINFSLTPTAKCSIGLATASKAFATTTRIDSPATANIQAQGGPDTVFVNIDLDFDIKGAVSGSGTVSGVGISGKTSGAESATLTYCHPVDSDVNPVAAIKDALSSFVFPLDPNCVDRLRKGSLANVNFNGTFAVELDVTYGLGDYKVSAPSIADMPNSLLKVMTLQSPSVEVNAGAKGSVSYTHSDHYSLLVSRDTESSAMLYLLRSAENDMGASAGIAFGVTSTNASVGVNQMGLLQTVQTITNNTALASAVVSLAAQPVNNLQTTLNAKLESWIGDITGQAGLQVNLARQQGRTALFTFKVDLTANLNAIEDSWAQLVGGRISITQANGMGNGITLQPGSGVSENLRRSSTIQFTFFNLFFFGTTDEFFRNAYAKLAPDGTIALIHDIGQEQDISTKTALGKFRIHFLATANEDVRNNVKNADIQLVIELTEKGKHAAALANVVGSIPAHPAVHDAQHAMMAYAAQNPNGILNLVSVITLPAFSKLSYSPYQKSTPPAFPEQDRDNWNAYQAAMQSLAGNLDFVSSLGFRDWQEFNKAYNGTSVADRHHNGGLPGDVPAAVFNRVSEGDRVQIMYYLISSAGFMNFCEDVKTLGNTQAMGTSAQWNHVLRFITDAVTNDVFIDYSKPVAGALLYLCSIGGARVTASGAQAKDASSMTCTITLL